MTADPVTVDQPKHPVHALTTSELRDYRRRLEDAIASLGTQDPARPACKPGWMRCWPSRTTGPGSPVPDDHRDQVGQLADAELDRYAS